MSRVFCEELNKHFATKSEMLSALVANKESILSIKRAKARDSDGLTSRYLNRPDGQIKTVAGLEDGFIYPVISNTNYLDSHGDVHLDGSMTKTAKEQQGRVHYVINHKLEIGKVIAYPKDVEMLIKEVDWKDLGKDYEGKTQALLFKTKLQDYSNDDARMVIEHKLPSQNSIRMQYLKVEMGVAERNKDWAEENKTFDKYASRVANKEELEQRGYAFFVTELRIVDEGSMVLLGSNNATPNLYTEETNQEPTEPTKATQEPEPTKVTQSIESQMLGL